ncbi:hypothetical protein ACVW0X_001668 [Bacillus subtilis]
MLKFTESGLEGVKAELSWLDDLMESKGLIRAGQWDYERVTYDKKFSTIEGTFYLRIQGIAAEGDVGSGRAVIQLMSPLLGKHYYPHGVEYGENGRVSRTGCDKKQGTDSGHSQHVKNSSNVTKRYSIFRCTFYDIVC